MEHLTPHEVSRRRFRVLWDLTRRMEAGTGMNVSRETLTFTRDNLPADGFESYQKRQTTRAKRIDGPFRVRTREGEITCQDGWLAIDAHGWPYPIADEEFRAIYEPAVE